MKYLNYLILFVLSLSLCTCISPFEVDVPDKIDGIVVVASLTTQKGLQEVRLWKPTAFTTKALNVPVSKAKVWISDNTGQRFDFTEDRANAGWYLPSNPDFVGEVGKTYVLRITTLENDVYESKPETIRAVPPIKKIHTEAILTDDSRLGEAVGGYNVLLDTEDPASRGDYYRWSWRHFESVVYCSEFFGVPFGQRNPTFVGLTCCELPCWDIERCYINCSNVMSDALINGKSITRHPITSIPFCAKDYYIEIQQRSISKGAHDYWRTVEQLSSNNGSLFDTAPAAVRGNISSSSNSSLPAYGYFEVSDVYENGFFINRALETRPAIVKCDPTPINANPFACAPCVESATRTKIKPKYWTK